MAQQDSTRDRILASTMSVDEYFDELISLVRQDYANPTIASGCMFTT